MFCVGCVAQTSALPALQPQHRPPPPTAATRPQQAEPEDPSEAARAKAARAQKAEALKQRALSAAARAEASVGLAPLTAVMQLAAAAGGPLAALGGWLRARRRVTVVTRHAAGVRGRAMGTLVAFDRYMNLVLRDVEERYTVIVKVERVKQQLLGAAGGAAPGAPQQQGQQQQQQGQLAGGAPSAQQGEEQQQVTRQRVRWCRKQEHRFRRLDLVMVKGDQVVLVAAAPGEGEGGSGGGGGGGASGVGGG
jgi:small nuclear ribonucleoprotein (snRNP)-like protein